MERSNTPKIEFKIMVIKILTGLKKRVEDNNETLNYDPKTGRTNSTAKCREEAMWNEGKEG